jgi:hypothetical protein
MSIREPILRLRDKANSVYTGTLQRAYFRFLGHQVAQRFAIVGNARTGSNYLLDGLKTSAAIRMYHEILQRITAKSKGFQQLPDRLPTKADPLAVGFKVFYNHLTDDEWKSKALDDLKVIHL